LPSANFRRVEDDPNARVDLLRSIHDGHERVPFLQYPLRWGFAAEELITGTFSDENSDLAAAVQWISKTDYPPKRHTFTLAKTHFGA
jgi:hypothetical protein